MPIARSKLLSLAAIGLALAVTIATWNTPYVVLPVLCLPLYVSARVYRLWTRRRREERHQAEQLAEAAAAAHAALARAVLSESALAAEKEQLALQTARLSATLRTIGDGVVTVNEAGTVLLMNEAAQTVTVLTRANTLDQPVRTVFDALGYAPDVTTHALRRVLLDGEPVRLQHDEPGIGVLRRLVDVTGTPTRDADGDVSGAVWVIRDVSDAAQVELERSRATRLESLGTLAGGLAHDFNNILVGVVGNLSLAQAMLRREDASIAARLAEAEAACMRARGVTNQLLTFAKGGAPVKTTASIRQTVVECARFALSGSAVALRFSLADQLWYAEVDVTQIGQVVQSLVLNAKEAMPSGGVVSVTLENVAVGPADPRPAAPLAPGNYVRLSVHDSGRGIHPDHIGHIFDPYFTTKDKGSGLGLAISYSVVRAHGGAITVDSQPGQGCRFDVYLPASSRQTGVEQQELPLRAAGHGRILLMDDDAAVVEVARDMLEMLGYGVETASCGSSAIDRFREAAMSRDEFDAVILDLTVPGGVGGAEAVRGIRLVRPLVPVVVTSGYADDAVLAHFREYGFDGVLPKPFGMTDLKRAVEQALANASADRELATT